MPINPATKGKGAIKEKFRLKHLFKRRLDVHLKHHPEFKAPQVDMLALSKLFPVKDQGESSSCGGQAWAYAIALARYIRDGQGVELSAKDIYSHVYLPGGGSSETDLLNYTENEGVDSEADIPSYQNGNPPTEQFMETIQPRNNEGENFGLDNIVVNSFSFDGNNINQVKKAIDTGVTVCALLGNDTCWQTTNGIVTVPDTTQLDWGHWLNLVSYNDITKLVTAKNSWGVEAGDKGYYYIPYDYFSGGRVYGEWVLIIGFKGEYISLLEKIVNLYKNIIQLLLKK